MSVAKCAAIVFLLCVVSVRGWWCTGHMTVAEIAKQNMNSDALETVENVISQLSSMGPFPKIPTFVESACWADDLKYNLGEMKGWHFLNIPYNPTNYPIRVPDQVDNVAELIAELHESIKWTVNGDNQWELSFALANLIHFYGDIHQPLHVTDLFSSQFPTGDRGGNLFMMNFNGQSEDLHGFWDAICGQFVTDPNRPLSASGLKKIVNLANSFQQQFNFTNNQIETWNSSIMAQESYQYAVQYSYDNNNLQPGDTLSQSYISNCYTAAGQRVTLAGLRLGNELNYLFGGSQGKKTTAKHVYDRLTVLHTELQDHAMKMHKEMAAGQRAGKLKKF